MIFAAIREALRLAVVSALDVPDTDVYWKGTNAANSWHSWDPAAGRPPVRVELRLQLVQASGIDEVRQHYDSGSGMRTEELCGNRELTVSVRIESESQADGEDAVGQLASYLRTRLRRPTILAALQAAGLGLADILPTVTADYVDQDRDLSVSVTDLLVLAAESDKAAPTGTGWIEKVAVEFDGSEPDQNRAFEVPES